MALRAQVPLVGLRGNRVRGGDAGTVLYLAYGHGMRLFEVPQWWYGFFLGEI